MLHLYKHNTPTSRVNHNIFIFLIESKVKNYELVDIYYLIYVFKLSFRLTSTFKTAYTNTDTVVAVLKNLRTFFHHINI